MTLWAAGTDGFALGENGEDRLASGNWVNPAHEDRLASGNWVNPVHEDRLASGNWANPPGSAEERIVAGGNNMHG